MDFQSICNQSYSAMQSVAGSLSKVGGQAYEMGKSGLNQAVQYGQMGLDKTVSYAKAHPDEAKIAGVALVAVATVASLYAAGYVPTFS